MTATLAIIGMMTAVLGSDQSGNKRQAKFVPLIQVSGTTAPSGELKVSPSVLLYLNPRVDLQLSPIFKATTKDGSATLNLAQPSDSSGWAAGGGFVAHILHEHGSVSDCSRTPHSKVCKVLAEAVQECDRLLEVEPISSCSKTACPEKPEDKAYCAARPSLSESPRQVPPGKRCAAAQDLTARQEIIETCDKKLKVRPTFHCQKPVDAPLDRAYCDARTDLSQGSWVIPPEKRCVAAQNITDPKKIIATCDKELKVARASRCRESGDDPRDRAYCEARPDLSMEILPEQRCAAAQAETDTKEILATCDKALKAELAYTCRNPGDDPLDKNYCTARSKVGANAANVDSGALCKRGKQIYDDRAPPDLTHDRRYPLAQMYMGALVGSRTYDFFTLDGDTPSKLTEPRRSVALAAGFMTITSAGLPKLPLTIEMNFLYRTKSTPSSTPVRWCQDQGAFAADSGTSVQSCMDGVLGPPTASESLVVSALLGGVDVVSERWRIAAGPEVSYHAFKMSQSFGFKMPVTVRLTPATGTRGYLGDYKGALRVTPVIGWEWDRTGSQLGTKVLLVIDLLAQQDLFGSVLSNL